MGSTDKVAQCYANANYLSVHLFTFQGNGDDWDSIESGPVENMICIELGPCFVASLMPINVTSELSGWPSRLDRVWYVVATVQEWIRALRSTACCLVI